MTRPVALLLAVAALIAVFLLPQWLSPFHTRVAQLFFFSAALALAWNILGGLAGYWSFGHTVFIGIGAFAAAHFTLAFGPIGKGIWSMVIPVLFSGLVCGIFALIFAWPLLRLRGVYFSIAMLGVAQVVGELVNNLRWFQGGVGVFLKPPVPKGVPPEDFFYYIFAGLLALCLGVQLWVMRSKFGHGLLAIREDEDTAMMLGVSTERHKTAAFVLSAVLVGILGAVYAYSVGYFTTATVFRMDFSLNMIVFCLIGGIGSLFGPVIGTAVMLFITQVLLSSFLDIHLLITGLIVVTIILLMPGGVLGSLASWRKSRRAAAAAIQQGEV